MSQRPPVWRAEVGGEGHAFARPDAPRTLCDERGWPERYDHPITTRCQDCLRLIGGLF